MEFEEYYNKENNTYLRNCTIKPLFIKHKSLMYG